MTKCAIRVLYHFLLTAIQIHTASFVFKSIYASCKINKRQIAAIRFIQIDVERAQNDSPFGSTIAHGLLLLSLIPGLRGFDQDAMGYWGSSRLMIINNVSAVRFLTPVKADAKIRSRTKLLSVKANKRSLDIREEVSVEIKNRNKLAFVADLTLRIYLD